MARVTGPEFDKVLKATQSSAVYYGNKSKAGRIGGSVSKLPHHIAVTRGEAMGLANIKNKTIEMHVLCRKDIERYKAAKHYNLVVETGDNSPAIISPYEYSFKNWSEFIVYFKRIKNAK